ncbi:MAG: preprotein translocase subunit YajC [Alphaproteobacteria bacterium]|nr:preprotein translocase subunit YajC [Alphaproteobacteria bacterium]
MFISPAYAQAAGAGGGDFITGILPLILIFVVFYFLLIRPQQKRMKEHKAKVAAVRRGDKVITGGGIIGTVTKDVSDTEIQVEIAEGVRVRVAKQTLSDVLTKTEPAPANDSGAEKGEKKSIFRRGKGDG